MAKSKTLVYNGKGSDKSPVAIQGDTAWEVGEERTLDADTAAWVLAANPAEGEGDPYFSEVKSSKSDSSSSSSKSTG